MDLWKSNRGYRGGARKWQDRCPSVPSVIRGGSFLYLQMLQSRPKFVLAYQGQSRSLGGSWSCPGARLKATASAGCPVSRRSPLWFSIWLIVLDGHVTRQTEHPRSRRRSCFPSRHGGEIFRLHEQQSKTVQYNDNRTAFVSDHTECERNLPEHRKGYQHGHGPQ